MKFGKSQKSFLAAFKKQLSNWDDDFFILTGDAGTGKTELIKECTRICESNNIDTQTLAFTGRAASVLRDREIGSSRTIASWLTGLGKNQIFNSEEFVIFIDEASMISNSAIIFEDKAPELDFLLDEIIWASLRHTAYKKILFVFVGDANQLPPLKHELCPALDSKYLKIRYSFNGTEFRLEQNYRQDNDSNIPEISENFKVTNNISSREVPSIANNEDLIQISDSDVLDIFFEYFYRNKYDIKIITSTNKRSDYYNFLIKEKLHPGSSSDYQAYQLNAEYLSPEIGDLLQVFGNNRIWEQSVYNGQFLEVHELGSVKEFIVNGKNSYTTFPFLYQEISASYITEDGAKSKDSFKLDISIDHLVNNNDLTKDEFNFFESSRDGILNTVKEDIKLSTGSGSIYFRKDVNPVLSKYGYAITGHKSQGGGWGNVIIDFEGFSDDMNELTRQWIYTAITRSKGKVYMVNYPR